tara:strand:+ start:82 stop:483 length:402 start_codon:yes stop_codon:yes gene_type:complete
MKKSLLQKIIREELNKAITEARGSGPLTRLVRYHNQDVINAVYELEEELATSNVDFEEIGDIVVDIIDAAAEEASNRDSVNEADQAAYSMLDLLSASDFIRAKDSLSDQIPPADFDKINKLYKLLYSELKKHE